MNDDLKHVLDTAVKLVNFVKSRPLNTRLLESLCNEMGKDHEQLLFHTEVRWLSRGKVLNRLYELREEVLHLLIEKKSPLAEHLEDNNWLAKLSFLADMFDKLNVLNLSLQGPQTNAVTLSDKVAAFMAKLELWKARVATSFQAFPQLNSHVEFAAGTVDIDSLKHSINLYLGSLHDQFQDYFSDVVQKREQHFWIADPFAVDLQQSTQFTPDEESEVIELQHDHTLQGKFKTLTISEFWLSVETEFPNLSRRAVNYLLPFASTYLCECGFSALTRIKNRYRSRLFVEDDLRACLTTNLQPRFAEMCSKKQAHTSH